MSNAVFLCGPWTAPRMLALLGVQESSGRAADLPDHRLCARPAGLPVLVPAAGEGVAGALYRLDADGAARLAALQALFGAEPVGCALDSGDMATVYRTGAQDLPGWPDRDWSEARADLLFLACAEMAVLCETHPVAALDARWPMALSHAASILRGRAEVARATLRRDWTREDVMLERLHQPYAWYFGVREDDLRFRRFDDSLSDVVKRAGFVMSDAVTVLPYDPKRDRVMLVEQFRYGPWLRGVRNPWSLEPIAGRVDPFETPELAALREAQEETGLTLEADRLVAVGNAYPSPGAITEYLYHYVALCDLPDGSEGVSGLETEAEDIRSHVISFNRLMELVTSGEAQNGPLVLTAWWLAAHRDGLRAG
ncbi:MAG: NUDIX hydrolase [Natronohydrobacter sp.]|nr:NUDIX hydrolase [Natronohydrobacter sp.]